MKKKMRVVDYSRTEGARTVEAHAAGQRPSAAEMSSAIDLLSPENRWQQVVSYVEWKDFLYDFGQKPKESVAA